VSGGIRTRDLQSRSL